MGLGEGLFSVFKKAKDFVKGIADKSIALGRSFYEKEVKPRFKKVKEAVIKPSRREKELEEEVKKLRAENKQLKKALKQYEEMKRYEEKARVAKPRMEKEKLREREVEAYKPTLYSAVITYIRRYVDNSGAIYYKTKDAVVGVQTSREDLIQQVYAEINRIQAEEGTVVGIQYSTVNYDEEGTASIQQETDINEELEDDYIEFLRMKKRLEENLPEDAYVEITEADINDANNYQAYVNYISERYQEEKRKRILKARLEKEHEALEREYEEAQKQKKLRVRKKWTW